MDEDFNIEQYNYSLPEEQIAKFPLKERDQSKLLVWKNGSISHRKFEDAPGLIPENSLLVFNDTRVIAARLHFEKTTGAQIELFLLHPELPTRDIAASMALEKSAVWFCLIGNKKKWKTGNLTLHIGDLIVTATYYNRDENLIRFEWPSGITFAEIVNKTGETPLPPYLKRKPVENDAERYQTIYSRNDGAVAAPTAGLHFTESILNQIKARNINLEYLTLHVSAGTFKPVDVMDYRDHPMHCEQIIIKKESIQNLFSHGHNLIAVGTTSLRILESLYWYGAMLSRDVKTPFHITKNMPYESPWAKNISFTESLKNILNMMDSENSDEIHGETEIFIYPGYEIRTAKGIFTNFHLPKSTLLLLVSTFTGQAWKEIYQAALSNNYRFLSYGDSSLILR